MGNTRQIVPELRLSCASERFVCGRVDGLKKSVIGRLGGLDAILGSLNCYTFNPREDSQ